MTTRLSSEKGFFGWLTTMKVKLIAGILLLAIVPVVTLGITSNLKIRKNTYVHMGDSALQMTQQISQTLNTLLQGIEFQLDVLGQTANFTSFSVDTDRAIFNQALLDGMSQSRTDVHQVYLAADHGIQISPKQVILADFNLAERNWYTGAVSAPDRLIVNGPYQDLLTGERVLTLSKAVVKQGRTLGVIGIDLNLNTIMDQMNHMRIGETGYVTLLDKEGLVVTHPNSEFIGTDAFIQSTGLWEKLTSRLHGYQKHSANGQQLLYAFDTNPYTEWKIVSVLEYAEITAASQSVRKITYLLMTLFGLFSIGAASYISNTVNSNLDAVKAGYSQASQGDLTARIQVKTKDEFKDLELLFTDMMQSLASALKQVRLSSSSVLQTSSSLSEMATEANVSIHQVAEAMNQIAQGNGKQSDNIQASVAEISSLSEKLDLVSASVQEIDVASSQSSKLGNEGLTKVAVLTEKSLQTKETVHEVNQVILAIAQKVAAIHTMLAEQARTSVVDISQIMEEIEAVVQQAVNTIEQSDTVIAEQDNAVEATSRIFHDILSSINRLAQLTSEVENNVTDIQQNKENVVDEINSISAVAQQIAASSEEVSASAEQISAAMAAFMDYSAKLHDISQKLDEEVVRFKLD